MICKMRAYSLRSIRDGFCFSSILVWQIVSSNEANFAEHKISDDSPIGKAALKKKVGETFQVFAPVGTLLFEVLEIGK